MPPQLNFTEMSRLAWVLCALSNGESACARTALAWAFRNRLEALAERAEPLSFFELCDRLGNDSRANETATAGPTVSDFQSPDYCLALSSLCSVWSGDQADPTEGALCFHRHNMLPRWASAMEPCALIGSFFFYNKASELSFARPLGRMSGRG